MTVKDYPVPIVTLFVVEGSLFQLFKGSAELVWAGSAFCATADAIETFDDVVDMLTAY
jgi:hypothetical protein